MARGSSSSESRAPSSTSSASPPGDTPPDVAPPRKRPWLLALACTLMLLWLLFLASMAAGLIG